MTGGTEYLRAAEIAALTGMSIRTIRRWIEDGTLPSTKVGGARLVAIADLKAVLSGSPERLQETPHDHEECEADHSHEEIRESIAQGHVPCTVV